MQRILVIAYNTFTEVVRQPVYLIILFIAIFLTLISPYITIFALLKNLKLVKDMALATLLLSGLFIAGFSSSNVIYKEIENRTVYTVITKPIRRSHFVIGKYLGIFLGLLIAEYILTIVMLQVVRTEITEANYSATDYPVLLGYIVATLITFVLGAYANFFFEKPFTSSAIVVTLPTFTVVFLLLCFVDNTWKLQGFANNLDTNMVIAAILVFLATSLLASIAVAASTRLSPIPTMLLSFLFFFMGLFSDYIFGRNAEDYWVCQVLYHITPNLQIYWVVDAILEERSIPFDYIWYALGYTFCFLVGILSFAVALFENRETQ